MQWEITDFKAHLLHKAKCPVLSCFTPQKIISLFSNFYLHWLWDIWVCLDHQCHVSTQDGAGKGEIWIEDTMHRVFCVTTLLVQGLFSWKIGNFGGEIGNFFFFPHKKTSWNCIVSYSPKSSLQMQLLPLTWLQEHN